MKLSRQELAKMIDHTLIKPTATANEVKQLCREAKKYGFKCAVINPYFVTLAHDELKTSNVKVCSTIGFPMGATLPEIKAEEARKAVEFGAQELDMVMNISAFKSGDHEATQKDIEAVVDVKCLDRNTIVKVIIETGFLTDREKSLACRLVKEAKADFVKTSTGLFSGRATVEDIKLMRRIVGKEIGVKAAGGIRTLKDTLAMIEAGANRIGTSTAIKIIEEMPKKQAS